jgi:lipid-binding SYLF domain-containing protein
LYGLVSTTFQIGGFGHDADSTNPWRRAHRLAAIALIAPRAEASAAKINADVRASLDQFFRQTTGARQLTHNAAGVLVFPTVVKAGFGIGGEYGEGALLIAGRRAGYYNLVSASFGFQLGAQARTS